MTPKEWVESLREQKPYYWPKPNGMGAPGYNNSKGQPDILKSRWLGKKKCQKRIKIVKMTAQTNSAIKELAAKHGIKTLRSKA
ncbi:hypothetical protein KAB08_02269 [Acinetobacter baumannii]|nr:hypothetical protein KAB08_02269 [Acinetobacter baumannii]